MNQNQSSKAQQGQASENAKRQQKDPLSPGFDKKLDGENRPAE
jgi:hypothetical protein